ncbi:hypothetical protein [Corticimicrobacter populi]|uniref:Uncharacterized protein n=1 Tax=Corticimicrobacter populi TaxID=2175229 RepID=A0A2V1K1Q9_9BURK|nr:hypothetical protein [Corticimicrobacter populi]PWF24046.1 hypothetical protein DD235_06910 [Corticimicrobacter populi]
MNLQQLADALYDDLNGYIHRVEDTGTDALLIHLGCDDWVLNEQQQSIRSDAHDAQRRFVIRCRQVMESNVRPTQTGELIFTDHHPLLWDYTEPHGGLYYAGETTASAHEILGRIYDAQTRILRSWRPLQHYANSYRREGNLIFGTDRAGLLARGPKPLLDAYQTALDGVLRTYFVPSHTPQGKAMALIFDDCFLICREAEIMETDVSLQTRHE